MAVGTGTHNPRRYHPVWEGRIRPHIWDFLDWVDRRLKRWWLDRRH